MFRFFVLTWTALMVFPVVSQACSCIGPQSPCENLRSDAVFVGTVIETVSVKHPFEKNSWTQGYSMRFSVEEPISGDLGTEVMIETGNGGGDCGTPLPPGEKFLVFAYKNDKGEFWTGMCSGNRQLSGKPGENVLLDQYRTLTKKGTGTIFGKVSSSKPLWREDDLGGSPSKSMAGLILHANSDKFSTITKTTADGSFEFEGLPNGKYTVTPDLGPGWDFDHEYEDNYQANVSNGQCKNVSFLVQPATRIKGHITLPNGIKTIEVVAIPIHMSGLNQFSGKWDFTDEDNRFDLWPLPSGDYYVGVNINSSPKADAPFPPTYYPGVTRKEAAVIVHLDEGEVKELELPLPEIAEPRTVHFVAIGLDGKPLRKIYIQLEDLRHPGDAGSYVNVDLDNDGAGVLTIYSGYSYHLHGSHWVSYGNDWCATPVVISAGTQPVEVRFVMDHKDANCDLMEIDGLRK